jgi:hypothetical protein
MTARRRILVCALVAAACAPVSSAGAAGPPLPSSVSGKAGAVAPRGTERIVTRRAGHDTLVTAVRRGGGRVLRSRRIAGRWSIPPVALDGRTTGLPADGRTLVLVRPTRAFPPARARLAVLDARRLAVRRQIDLAGFYTVDAISPDGRWVYVIQYSGDSVFDYRVRALDTGTGRLAARDVVDPREPGEQMGGLPMTRVMSRDGRWAYTLYSGGQETFIHALDTVGRTAACIDLEMLPSGSDLSGVRLRLSADGERLYVLDRGHRVATVDARPSLVPERRAAAVPPADAGGGFPWETVLLAVGVAGLAGAAVRFARRRALRRSLAG